MFSHTPYKFLAYSRGYAYPRLKTTHLQGYFSSVSVLVFFWSVKPSSLVAGYHVSKGRTTYYLEEGGNIFFHDDYYLPNNKIYNSQETSSDLNL
jgi:hypothetical protein